MRNLIAWASLIAVGVAIQQGAAAEKKKPSPTATGTVEVKPLAVDGQPLKKNSVLLWRKVDSDAAKKGLWGDPKTDTWWEQVAGHATYAASTFNELEPGTYRITVRDGHDQSGAIGVSQPIAVDETHQTVSTTVQLTLGTTLRLNCLDAKTGRPIPPPDLNLQVVRGDCGTWWQFRAVPVAGLPGQFEFQHLSLGQYRLNASRQATNPVDRKYDLAGGEIKIDIDTAQPVARELKFTSSPLTDEEIERDWPFVVFGRVTDKKGQPIPEAVVRAHTGFGTMFQTGATVTDADGRYRLHFAQGGFVVGSGVGQAIVTASKPGMAEANLSRQGEFTLAPEQPKPGELAKWLEERPLLLAHKPAELNFTLSPVGTLNVRIHREGQRDLAGFSVDLKGAEMPPGCSVIDSGRTDKWGEVSFAEVPLDREWWIEFEPQRREPIRTQPFKLTDPQRYELSLDWRTDATGIESLETASLTDSLNRDRTLELIGDDSLSHPPASAREQKQVQE